MCIAETARLWYIWASTFKLHLAFPPKCIQIHIYLHCFSRDTSAVRNYQLYFVAEEAQDWEVTGARSQFPLVVQWWPWNKRGSFSKMWEWGNQRFPHIFRLKKKKNTHAKNTFGSSILHCNSFMITGHTTTNHGYVLAPAGVNFLC